MQISKYIIAAVMAGVVSVNAVADNSYEGGILIMNEEKSGNPQNGSINFFNPEGEGSWSYRVFRQANPDKEIPGAICHAVSYGDKLYIVSNHPITVGSYDMVGTLTILDAETLDYINSVELVNSYEKSVLGRAVMPVNDNIAYISTTDGLLRYNFQNNTISDQFSQFHSPDGVVSPVPYQYPYQTGSMAKWGDMVYVASQSFGLAAIPVAKESDAKYLSLTDLFGGKLPEGITEANGIGSVVIGNDGNLWMSITSDKNATGSAAPFIVKYDPATSEAEAIAVPDGIYPPANSWYAWTADGFHASATENALYWNGGENSWFSNMMVFKYDIDTNRFSTILDLNKEELPAGENAWMIYGCSMRTSPISGEMYLSLFKDYASTDYILRRIDTNGVKIADYQMSPDYWFPSLLLFVDTKYPVFEEFETLTLPSDKMSEINLLGMATDVDSPNAEITYAVKSVSHDAQYFKAETDGRRLFIYPGEDVVEQLTAGWIEIEANSQGKKAVGRLLFSFSQSALEDMFDELKSAEATIKDGLLTLRTEAPMIAEIYTPAGLQVKAIQVVSGETVCSLSDLSSGLYILRLGQKTIKFSL